jgi:hypothetical protein
MVSFGIETPVKPVSNIDLYSEFKTVSLNPGGCERRYSQGHVLFLDHLSG